MLTGPVAHIIYSPHVPKNHPRSSTQARALSCSARGVLIPCDRGESGAPSEHHRPVRAAPPHHGHAPSSRHTQPRPLGARRRPGRRPSAARGEPHLDEAEVVSGAVPASGAVGGELWRGRGVPRGRRRAGDAPRLHLEARGQPRPRHRTGQDVAKVGKVAPRSSSASRCRREACGKAVITRASPPGHVGDRKGSLRPFC